MNEATRSDLIDRITQAMAIGAVIIGLLFGTDAAVRILSGDAAELVDTIGWVLKGIGSLVFIWLAYLVFMKWQRLRRGEAADEHGFTAELSKRACCASWIVTFVILILFDDVLVAQTPGFMLDAIMAVMLVAYGISFFVFETLVEEI